MKLNIWVFFNFCSFLYFLHSRHFYLFWYSILIIYVLLTSHKCIWNNSLAFIVSLWAYNTQISLLCTLQLWWGHPQVVTQLRSEKKSCTCDTDGYIFDLHDLRRILFQGFMVPASLGWQLTEILSSKLLAKGQISTIILETDS